jgi:AraC-like DNA-binding protein
VRLLLARSRFIAVEGNAISIAFDVDYDGPTNFSRECARQVGLPPSKDVRHG